MYACEPRAQEMEEEGSGVYGHPGLHSEFETVQTSCVCVLLTTIQKLKRLASWMLSANSAPQHSPAASNC